jgi:hypothetical protein
MPPAPPKATSANRRGSWPRSTDTTRIARSMLAFATRTMPSASSPTVSLSAARQVLRGRSGAIDVDRHPPAEERTPDRDGQQKIGVGDREFVPTP